MKSTVKPDLDELARLHAAATPGDMSVDRYHTLLDKDGKHVLFTGIQTPMTSGERQDQARANMAEYAALHNAFPGLLARLEAAERERDTATDDEAGHWIGIIRSLDPENLCDVFDGLGFEENLRQWLAARDAQQRREGAAEWLEKAAREGGYYERSSEGMLEEAKQLREGK